MSLLMAPLLVLALFLLQGVLFQVSVALTGEAAPRYGRALVTSLLGGLVATFAGIAFGLTAGLVLMFFSKTLAAALGGAFTIGAVAFVYRGRLHTSFLHALVVAAIHQALSAVLVGALTMVYRLF